MQMRKDAILCDKISFSRKTSLGLPQWVEDDEFKFGNFNYAFALLDDIIQEQNRKIAALEAEVNNMKRKKREGLLAR